MCMGVRECHSQYASLLRSPVGHEIFHVTVGSWPACVKILGTLLDGSASRCYAPHVIGSVRAHAGIRADLEVVSRDYMRFHIGAIPEAPDFSPDAPWRPLREPTPWVMQLVALPIAIAVALIVALLWSQMMLMRQIEAILSIPFILFSFAGIVVIHELIHALVHPMAGRSPHSILGIWPSRVLFYAHYDGELRRNRFVGILLMPLVIISLVPLILAALKLIPASGSLAYISILNASVACGDVLGAGITLFQVPTDAIVRNQSWRTYWKEH